MSAEVVKLDSHVLADLKVHAANLVPRECCGVVIERDGVQRYWPCANRAQDAGQFIMDAEDYARAEDAGQVLAICHSHVGVSAHPSMADRAMQARGGVPWVIVNWPTGATVTFSDETYRAPLIGRDYVHGIHDCYGLVRDWYADHGITLPDFEREPLWWTRGTDLIFEKFPQAGFVVVDSAARQPGDVIVMRIMGRVPNHCGVWLDGDVMLHHLMNRKSERVVYGGWWREVTSMVLRHQSLIPNP